MFYPASLNWGLSPVSCDEIWCMGFQRRTSQRWFHTSSLRIREHVTWTRLVTDGVHMITWFIKVASFIVNFPLPPSALSSLKVGHSVQPTLQERKVTLPPCRVKHLHHLEHSSKGDCVLSTSFHPSVSFCSNLDSCVCVCVSVLGLQSSLWCSLVAQISQLQSLELCQSFLD